MSSMKVVSNTSKRPCCIKIYLDGVELKSVSYLHPVNIDDREVTITFNPSELIAEYSNGDVKKIF